MNTKLDGGIQGLEVNSVEIDETLEPVLDKKQKESIMAQLNTKRLEDAEAAIEKMLEGLTPEERQERLNKIHAEVSGRNLGTERIKGNGFIIDKKEFDFIGAVRFDLGKDKIAENYPQLKEDENFKKVPFNDLRVECRQGEDGVIAMLGLNTLGIRVKERDEDGNVKEIETSIDTSQAILTLDEMKKMRNMLTELIKMSTQTRKAYEKELKKIDAQFEAEVGE
jgi:hypothetical protein